MSIIEKAAGRLPRKGSAPSPQPEGKAAATNASQVSAPEAAIAAVSAVAVTTIAEARREAASSGKSVDLDLRKLGKAGMVTPDAERSAIAEEFRAIKRSLLMQAFQPPKVASRPNNLIMVTSSVPGEGKTFCAINLAISIAMERDRTVLLVDADVARPSVLRQLGLAPEAGLMDLLLEPQMELGDVLLQTNVDKFRILPAGTPHRHATELLASQAMSKLLNELATRYPDRIVIFDSPPLLPTSEARVLAHQMGQIVMVVEAEKTTQRTLTSSLRHLENCPSVSLLYNKANAFSGDEAYGYYYHY